MFFILTSLENVGGASAHNLKWALVKLFKAVKSLHQRFAEALNGYKLKGEERTPASWSKTTGTTFLRSDSFSALSAFCGLWRLWYAKLWPCLSVYKQTSRKHIMLFSKLFCSGWTLGLGFSLGGNVKKAWWLPNLEIQPAKNVCSCL